MLNAVKKYLHKDWITAAEDNELIQSFIDRGMARLNRIAGRALDYTVEDLPRQLLFDYVRYADSQALEAFEANFAAELLSLNIAANLGELPTMTEDTDEDKDTD